MKMTESICQHEAVIFLDKLFVDLQKNNILLAHHWDIDHLCYRCDSQQQYKQLKESFSNFADLLVESPINGRAISIFKLNKPILYNDYMIDLIELPAPKINKMTVTGFEHAEVVCDWSFEEIKDYYRHANFDESGTNKNFNADIEICMSESSLKFHHLSLESVINLETHTQLWSALESLALFQKLAVYRPLLAGTFPLGLSTRHSDVDILLESNDLGHVRKCLEELFNIFENFEIYEKMVKSNNSLICRFSYQGLSFELFAQELTALKQDAYQHLLIEEKLLKRGGPNFKKRILDLKKLGFETEPAFAKELRLEGCPFTVLKELQRSPIRDLSSLKYV